MDYETLHVIFNAGSGIFIAGTLLLAALVTSRVAGPGRALAAGGFVLIAVSQLGARMLSNFTIRVSGLEALGISYVVLGNLLPLAGLVMIARALIVATRRSHLPDVSGLATEPPYQRDDPSAPPLGTQEL